MPTCDNIVCAYTAGQAVGLDLVCDLMAWLTIHIQNSLCTHFNK